MTADELADRLAARGIDVRRHGREYRVPCPVHDDPTPSVDFRDGDTGVIVQCRAGCATGDVVNAWNLTLGDLFHARREGPTEPLEAYAYRDETGALLYEVLRFPDKRFRQRRPDGNGGWIWNLDGVRRVPYRLPEIIAAVEAGKTVCICEGEKDVHALERIGRIATCNPGGAGKWRDEYAQYFKGGGVVIIADRDEPGRAHAQRIAESLAGVTAEVLSVEPATGNDASDHLATLGFADFLPLGSASQNGRKIHDRIIDMGKAFVYAGEPLPLRCGMVAIDGRVTTLAGSRAERKSWLMIALCAGVSDGGEVAGIRCEKGTALYVDAENGEREMARRFVNAGLGPDTFYVADGFGLHLPRDTPVLRELITATKANLCILDSLRRLAPGVREDRSDDMAPVYAELSRLARDTHCALIVLHHRSTKFGAPDTRGSSAIEDQTDLLYVLEGMRGDPQRRMRKRLRCSKNRADVEPPPRWLRFDRIAGFMTVGESEPYEAEGDDEEEATPVAEQLTQAIRELAPEVRKDGAWSPARLAEAVGRARDDWAFKQALGALLESGEWLAEGKTRARVVRPAPDSGGEDFPYGEPPDRPNPLEGLDFPPFAGETDDSNSGDLSGDDLPPETQPPESDDDDSDSGDSESP